MASTPTVEADCEGRAAPPGTKAETYVADGQARQYLLTLPPDYDGAAAVPMTLSLHGFSSNEEAQETNTAMARAGGERGYVVVTPGALGTPSQWNAFGVSGLPDDYAYIQALVAALSHRLCIDTDRVYVAGHSNGGAFAAYLACREPFQFAAVAMVAATTPNTCPTDVNPPTLAVHGTADATVPYGGGRLGGSELILPPAAEIVTGYVTQRACNPAPVVSAPHLGVQRATFNGCRGSSVVVFDSVFGGTHSWPGSVAAMGEPGNSDAGRTYDTTAAIYDFFDAH